MPKKRVYVILNADHTIRAIVRENPARKVKKSKRKKNLVAA